MAAIDFTGDDVKEPSGPELLRKGTYRAVITDVEEREVKSGDFAGNDAYNLELTVSECIEDPEYDVDGKKTWDFFGVIPPHKKNGKDSPGSFGRIKQIARVTGIDTDKPLDLEDVDGDGTTWQEHLNGQEVIVKVRVSKGGKNKETGQEYDDRNQIVSYHTEDELEAGIR